MAVAHGGTPTRRFAPRTVGASRLDAKTAAGVPTVAVAPASLRSALATAHGGTNTRRFAPRTVGASRLAA